MHLGDKIFLPCTVIEVLYRLQQRDGSDLHVPFFPSTQSMLYIACEVIVLWKELPSCSGESKMYNKVSKLIWL